MRKFWNWKNQDGETPERVLELNGTIADESWFDDDITPQMFKDELNAGSGAVTIWINSPGGDCVAASQIYSMLMDYAGEVTVKIDGIAASAASVIAMAGTKVLMSPTALMMIHNPSTAAFGDHNDMQKAIDLLEEVKQSIINAYEIKTGQSRAVLSHLMENETWMNVRKAWFWGRYFGRRKENRRRAVYVFHQGDGQRTVGQNNRQGNERQGNVSSCKKCNN